MRGFASWTRVPVVTTTNARKGDPKGDADERKMEVRGERRSETGRVGPTRKKRKKKGNSTKMEGWPKKKDERGRRTPTSIPRRWNFLFLFFLFFFLRIHRNDAISILLRFSMLRNRKESLKKVERNSLKRRKPEDNTRTKRNKRKKREERAKTI